MAALYDKKSTGYPERDVLGLQQNFMHKKLLYKLYSLFIFSPGIYSAAVSCEIKPD